MERKRRAEKEKITGPRSPVYNDGTLAIIRPPMWKGERNDNSHFVAARLVAHIRALLKTCGSSAPLPSSLRA